MVKKITTVTTTAARFEPWSGRMKEIYGISLLEFMVIAACISLMMSVIVPAYRSSKGSERIEDLALSASSRVAAIEEAVERYGIKDFDSLDGGAWGIPENTPVTSTLHGMSVTNGEIVMTWKNDATFMHDITYTIRPRKLALPLTWDVGGSCVIKGYC